MQAHRVRLAAWQEQVLAKANFVAYERDRLRPRVLRNEDAIYAATDVPLNEARKAAGVQENGEPSSAGQGSAGPSTGSSTDGPAARLEVPLSTST